MMMINNNIALIFLLTLTSCAMYQQDFDCPPPCGVPCTSVTDLESMVVEMEQGPDLFMPYQESAISRLRAAFKHKVWVAEGCPQGYYLYQINQQDPHQE